MRNVALKIENVSKLYRLGQVGTGMFFSDINRWYRKKIGKEDKYGIVGIENDRTKKGGDFAWALQNISFDVKQGEVIGLIGRNGAGKSTLLKLLSRVTTPTSGKIYARGKMVSLLEVGTGFHPELTGKENIYLNAAILGMNKAEVKSKLEAIIDFAGVAKYIDTPVKRYSSGMKVRLGFAVAAHLEPDILVVDEVLAVGDAEFQNKAIGKMQEVSNNQGRTVIYVSHNMSSIRKLCNRGIVLDKGRLTYQGNVQDAINVYFNQFTNAEEMFAPIVNFSNKSEVGDLVITRTIVRSKNVINSIIFPSNDAIECEIDYLVRKEILGMRMSIQLQAFDSTALFASSTYDIEPSRKSPGSYSLHVQIPANLLNDGKYFLCVRAGIPNVREVLANIRVIGFEVQKVTANGSIANERFPGYFSVPLKMEINQTI